MCLDLLVVCALALGAQSAAAQPAGDPVVCYKSRELGPRGGLPAFGDREGEVVIDTFSTARPEDQHKVDLKKSIGLCAPASVEGELLVDPTVHLEAYTMAVTKTSPRQPKHGDSLHEIVNRFGTLKIRVRTEDRLLAPTAKALGTGGVEALNGAVDGFKCYDAKVARAATGAVPFPVFTPLQVSVADQFGTRVFKVTKLRRFCAPADVDGTNPSAPTHARYLVCYQVRVAATKPKQPKFVPTDVSTHPSFGPEALVVNKPDELCLPSFKDPGQPTPIPTPTVTFTPTSPSPTVTPVGDPVSLNVDPDHRTINQGAMTNGTCVATYANGATKNYTQRVEWSSSDPAIASVSNVDNERGRITGIAPGTIVLRARDPVTGIDSNDSGQNGEITVLGPLTSIDLTPVTASDTVGDERFFTAKGHFAGSPDKNITQDVDYASTNTAVAQATNEPGKKSRVVAVGVGVTTIRAKDPTTGIVSNDATYTVTAP
jgi:hypothetical protein